MKKLILLLALAFVMCECTHKTIGDESIGEALAVPIKKEATRLTITEDYIIIETCTGNTAFKQPFWRCDKILNNDSIHQEELIRKIKEQ